MGPYCRYCDNRCFVYFPQETPQEALDAYRPGVSIIATCRGGQAFEKETTGWCYDDIVAAIERKQQQNDDEPCARCDGEGGYYVTSHDADDGLRWVVCDTCSVPE